VHLRFDGVLDSWGNEGQVVYSALHGFHIYFWLRNFRGLENIQVFPTQFQHPSSFMNDLRDNCNHTHHRPYIAHFTVIGAQVFFSQVLLVVAL
jgi:hypothetical protein